MSDNHHPFTFANVVATIALVVAIVALGFAIAAKSEQGHERWYHMSPMTQKDGDRDWGRPGGRYDNGSIDQSGPIDGNNRGPIKRGGQMPNGQMNKSGRERMYDPGQIESGDNRPLSPPAG